MRLDPSFRWALYAVLALLSATGAAWLLTDQLKTIDGGDVWQAAGANLLMVHGGAAMVTLLLLGALFPLHIQRGWRARKNRITGTIIATFVTILIVTSFGLYYSGSETLRPWISDAHIAAGVALSAFIFVHVLLGRRAR